MKINFVKLPNGDCEQEYSGQHEWQLKWFLPDRECYKCKKCKDEIVIFEEE